MKCHLLSSIFSGKDYDTQIGGHSCTVEMLLEELYEKVRLIIIHN